MPSVLVVDDSPVDRRLAIALLQKQSDLTVGSAAHGAEALARLADQTADIVVTDLQMPGMDGLELVRTLRGRYPLVPVVLMTAHGSEEIAVAALEQGAASYVPKSKLAENLTETVNHVLAIASANRRHGLLLDRLHRSTWTFVLENDLALIYPMVDYLQQQIALLNLSDESGRIRVGIALQEALLNAMLHGNLQLTAQEIQREQSEPTGLVARRRAEPPYCDRRVHVYGELSSEHVRFIVRDDGSGFPRPNDAGRLGFGESETMGRGLVLMRAFMDEVSFNQSGNEVTLIKYTDRETG